jgi:Plasmid encoded RepA protein
MQRPGIDVVPTIDSQDQASGSTVVLPTPGSPRRLTPLLRAAVEIAANPPELEDTAWGAKCLASASLPYREPRPEQLQNGIWIRRNGDRALWIQGGPSGLPFGVYPRLFMIWLCGEAIRGTSRIISTGSTFSEFCRRVEIDRSRGARGSGRRFVDQVTRLLSSRVGTNCNIENGVLIAGGDHLQFTDSYRLFFAAPSPQRELFDSTIVLSQPFFEEVTQHCVPLDMRAVAALRASPLELDIYQWLAYRMYVLEHATRPSWPGLRGQFGSSHARMVDFRRDFLKALNRVLAVYPTAKVAATPKGLILFPSPTPIPRLTAE